MKLAFVALILSAQSYANTCFTRPVELETNRVTLAREICLDSIKLELDYFGASKAIVKITTDGTAQERSFSLNNGKVRADGSRLFVVSLNGTRAGGSCSEFWETKALASIVISKDAKVAELENVKGELYYSWDQCHDQVDLKQSFFYTKN